MKKINSLEELTKIGAELKGQASRLGDKDYPEGTIQIRVTMATCGIASGSRPVYDYLKEELEKRNIPARVTQTGCMGLCYAEPTIEITIPGKSPVIFGYVDTKRADEIIEKFIRKGEMVEGEIQVTYETV